MDNLNFSNSMKKGIIPFLIALLVLLTTQMAVAQATGMANINVGTFDAANADNTANLVTESQWDYDSST